MAVLRIQRKRIKRDFHYFLDNGEMVGEYRRKRFFETGYQASVSRDGKIRYVLRGLDLRNQLGLPLLLIGLFLPEGIGNFLIVLIIVILLMFPRPPVIRTEGHAAAKRNRQGQFFLGPDCYEFHEHNGCKASLMKNGVQIALYHRRANGKSFNPPYDVLYSSGTEMDVIILFCIYMDITDPFTHDMRSVAPWKSWGPWDKYRERAKWQPPDP